mmetsp:Transcript_5352/g.8262  ORF Transcript_5352/g.8262 Transcript_5352/m.8262 type:complete len:96 (+) Transcript_5352:207-494(+)
MLGSYVKYSGKKQPDQEMDKVLPCIIEATKSFVEIDFSEVGTHKRVSEKLSQLLADIKGISANLNYCSVKQGELKKLARLKTAASQLASFFLRLH